VADQADKHRGASFSTGLIGSWWPGCRISSRSTSGQGRVSRAVPVGAGAGDASVGRAQLVVVVGEAEGGRAPDGEGGEGAGRAGRIGGIVVGEGDRALAMIRSTWPMMVAGVWPEENGHRSHLSSRSITFSDVSKILGAVHCLQEGRLSLDPGHYSWKSQ